MSGGIETAADIATGGLFARAVEPHAGEAAHGAGHDRGLCLNCGTALIGDHCHACGQAAHVHRSLGAIGHELAHGVFHFEGKIWRTLPMLVFHPGALTRRYVNGERARFVSPLALFLFTVFLMFATISAVGGELLPDMTTQQQVQAKVGLDKQLTKARAEQTRVAQKLTAARAAGKPVDELRSDQTAIAMTIKGLETASSALGHGDAPNFTDLHTGWERLDHGIANANANPALVIYKLQTSAYKYSWGLIPLSVPFVALLFLWRRRFALYDHAIFVTYSLAFMMLLVIALIVCGVIGVAAGWITMAALLVPPIHMFAQLRGAYSLRKRSALWRTILLTIFAFVVLMSFVVLLLLHGLAE